jgi:hypothetical protein
MIKRWEAYTGKPATLTVTGETFEALSEARLGLELGSEAA